MPMQPSASLSEPHGLAEHTNLQPSPVKRLRVCNPALDQDVSSDVM